MLLTVAEVGERLKVSSSFVYRLVASGQLAVVRVGNGQGRIRINETDLQIYIDSRRVEEQGPKQSRCQPRLSLQHLKLPESGG